jgi:hypothetical protein
MSHQRIFPIPHPPVGEHAMGIFLPAVSPLLSLGTTMQIVGQMARVPVTARQKFEEAAYFYNGMVAVEIAGPQPARSGMDVSG